MPIATELVVGTTAAATPTPHQILKSLGSHVVSTLWGRHGCFWVTVPDDACPATAMLGSALSVAPAIRLFQSLGLGLALFLIYIANCRVISIGDAVPATLLPLTMIRGEGIALDRFKTAIMIDNHVPYYAALRRGKLVSLYPLAPGLIAAVFVWPQILIKDLVDPGWDADRLQAITTLMWMSKIAAAAIASLVGVALFSLLTTLKLGQSSLTATGAAALGSNLWMTGSQALWQHGPAALALTLTLLALTALKRSPWRLFLAGFTTGLLVCCRSQMLLLALPIGAWVMWNEGWRSTWFFIMPAVLGVSLIAYNQWYFASWIGGASLLESSTEHLPRHAVGSAWSTSVFEGFAGTLVSPSRGLFVFCPWVLISILVLPYSWVRLCNMPLVGWLLIMVVPFLLLNSAYAVWWGGYSFGPRYWTELFPLFAIVLALALVWSRSQRAIYGLLVLAITWSVAVQVVGAFCYPSGWNAEPVSVDLRHNRLWDWRDNELTRCVANGPRALWTIDGVPIQ